MMDYKQLAEGIEEMRESLRAIVAALMQDGFTEEQAREIATGIFAMHRRGSE